MADSLLIFAACVNQLVKQRWPLIRMPILLLVLGPVSLPWAMLTGGAAVAAIGGSSVAVLLLGLLMLAAKVMMMMVVRMLQAAATSCSHAHLLLRLLVLVMIASTVLRLSVDASRHQHYRTIRTLL